MHSVSSWDHMWKNSAEIYMGKVELFHLEVSMKGYYIASGEGGRPCGENASL